jgi:hypothetical protein
VEPIAPGLIEQPAGLIDVKWHDRCRPLPRPLHKPSYIPGQQVVAHGLLQRHPQHGVDVPDGRRRRVAIGGAVE